MARKRNRGTGSTRAGRTAANTRRKRGRLMNTHSLVFMGVLVLMIVALATASMLSRARQPDCPPGQVWSDAHNHCH